MNHLFGSSPTAADQASIFAPRWITSELVSQAMIRRVDPLTAESMIGRKCGAGLAIPFINPLTDEIVEYQIRLDNPPMEAAADGQVKAKSRYLYPFGRRGRAYFVPGADWALLHDIERSIVITEGPLKAIALHRLS